MSPWSRDQVRILLAPDRVVAVRLAGVLRRRVSCRRAEPVAQEGGTPAMLATLRELLADPQFQHADAVVLLSSRHARYQLLPWTDAVLDAAEASARARHAYARAQGDAAASLALRTSRGGFGAATVASGVEEELLSGVRQCFAGGTLRLASVQPYLMAAFNPHRRTLARGAQWFAVVESGTLCTALLARGQWVSLRSTRIARDWPGELLRALQRQGLAHPESEAATRVLVHAAGEAPVRFAAQAGWTIEQAAAPALAGGSAAADRVYAPVLAGLA